MKYRYIILLLAFYGCSEEPNFFELGKISLSKHNYSLAKNQFSAVPDNDPKHGEALGFIKKIDSIEESIILWEKDLEQRTIIEQAKIKESLLKKFKKEGIIGRWKSILPGNLDCIISIKENKGSFEASFYFPKDKSEGIKKLHKRNTNKYYIEGSSSGEFLIVNDDGSMILMDDVGLVTTGKSMMP